MSRRERCSWLAGKAKVISRGGAWWRRTLVTACSKNSGSVMASGVRFTWAGCPVDGWRAAESVMSEIMGQAPPRAGAQEIPQWGDPFPRPAGGGRFLRELMTVTATNLH